MDDPSLADPTVAPDDRPPEAELPRATPPLRRAIIKRSLFLGGTLVALYLLWPSLIAVFSASPKLLEIEPGWFVVMLVAEVASFACMWGLLKITIRAPGWFVVITSQLAGNAISRIVPGGAAAGPAVQYTMLERSGVPAPKVASGLTATSLIGLSVLLFLPVLAVPAVLAGRPIPSGLAQATLLGAVVFVLSVAAGALFLTTDGPLKGVARAVQWLRNRARHGRDLITDLPARFIRERDDLGRTLGGSWWQAILNAAGNSLFDYLALLSTLSAVGSSPRPSLVLLAYVGSRILSLIPITPGGLGFVEAGLTGMLVIAGVPGPEAVLATLAYRLVSFWLPLPAGLVAYILYRRRYPAPE